MLEFSVNRNETDLANEIGFMIPDFFKAFPAYGDLIQQMVVPEAKKAINLGKCVIWAYSVTRAMDSSVKVKCEAEAVAAVVGLTGDQSDTSNLRNWIIRAFKQMLADTSELKPFNLTMLWMGRRLASDLSFANSKRLAFVTGNRDDVDNSWGGGFERVLDQNAPPQIPGDNPPVLINPPNNQNDQHALQVQIHHNGNNTGGRQRRGAVSVHHQN